MTDPPDPSTGYSIDPVEVDAVTSSHSHHDHSYFEIAAGSPVRITASGEHTVGEVVIRGFDTFHDAQGGRIRGKNVVFIIEMDGIRILHAGDLGHIPDQATLSAMGQVDVMLIPIGGVYTIDHMAALELCNILRPNVVIPMHYKTADLAFTLGDLKPFLNAARGRTIHRMRQPELIITRESLGADRVIVLQYPRGK
jgi:L-ascorbate metabolism protein UlaG (beta-lactamase superfamily)